MINMTLDLTAAIAGLDKIAVTANEAVRPAAQAGAQVFYNEVKIRAKRGGEVRNLKGGKTRPAGALASAIYQAYSPENSSDKKATYNISWNKNKAFYGKFVEFGTSTRAKKPFLRPSYDAVRGAAEQAVNDELLKRLLAAL